MSRKYTAIATAISAGIFIFHEPIQDFAYRQMVPDISQKIPIEAIVPPFPFDLSGEYWTWCEAGRDVIS